MVVFHLPVTGTFGSGLSNERRCAAALLIDAAAGARTSQLGANMLVARGRFPDSAVGTNAC